MKLFSWNILGHNYLTLDNHKHLPQAYPQVADWQRRCELLCTTILKHNPDIICLQEVDMIRRNDFLNNLSLHGYQESAYQEKGNGGTLVLCKKDWFNVLEYGGGLLPTETKNGSCAWAVLQNKQTQKKLLVASVHLHWQYSTKQVALLKDALKTDATVPMLLVGDFNIAYKTMVDTVVLEINQLFKPQTFSLFEHESWTFFDATGWRSADHCVYSDDIKLDTIQSFIGDDNHAYKSKLVMQEDDIVTDVNKSGLPTDQYPSDHLPMIISFEVL